MRSGPARATFVFAAILAGCWDPDPRTIRGALERAAAAVEARDARELFSVIDQRARQAMASIATDRRHCAALISADYLVQDRASALQALGDARDARDAADLFALRCRAECFAGFARNLGAPIAQTPRGPSELEVRTSVGGAVRLHHGNDGWWGLVWNTQALSDERMRAARERLQVEANAEVYRRRRALETVLSP
jgi:hypothetical protein